MGPREQRSAEEALLDFLIGNSGTEEERDTREREAVRGLHHRGCAIGAERPLRRSESGSFKLRATPRPPARSRLPPDTIYGGYALDGRSS